MRDGGWKSGVEHSLALDAGSREQGCGKVNAGGGTASPATPLPIRNQGTGLCPWQHSGAELPSPLSHVRVQAWRLK